MDGCFDRTRAACVDYRAVVRDHVIPFQKFGTKLYTVPTLDALYDKLTYRERGDEAHGT